MVAQRSNKTHENNNYQNLGIVVPVHSMQYMPLNVDVLTIFDIISTRSYLHSWLRYTASWHTPVQLKLFFSICLLKHDFKLLDMTNIAP